jgi:hypothetical protein
MNGYNYYGLDYYKGDYRESKNKYLSFLICLGIWVAISTWLCICFAHRNHTLIARGTIVDKYMQNEHHTGAHGAEWVSTNTCFVIDFGQYGVIKITPTDQDYYRMNIGDRVGYDIFSYVDMPGSWKDPLSVAFVVVGIFVFLWWLSFID